jgi:sRNA-binding regulator protein Hfq
VNLESPVSAPTLGLEQRILRGQPFGLVLRNGEKWERCELIAMDRWSLLVRQAYGRRLVPKHAVDYYMLADAASSTTNDQRD